jgi:hypothetical protein
VSLGVSIRKRDAMENKQPATTAEKVKLHQVLAERNAFYSTDFPYNG